MSQIIPSYPIIVCGCHGGGTSYLAKLLRFNGLFMGQDAGNINNRKFHESKSFRQINENILLKFHNSDSCGFDIKTVDQMVLSLQDEGVVVLFASYINVNKDQLLNKFGLNNNNIPWGWKDPRNSLTFPLWYEVFPLCKVLILSKNVTKEKSKSGSGQWFKNDSSPEMRSLYMNPWWLNKLNKEQYLCTKFEEITTNFQKLNQVFQFCGLQELNDKSFQELLIKTKFETLA